MFASRFKIIINKLVHGNGLAQVAILAATHWKRSASAMLAV